MKLLLIAVAIIANQPGYYTSLANHIARWLKNESVPARVSPSQSMASSLKGEKLAFLVGFDSVTAQQMKLLRDFRAGGGKLVVFHSASPALADLMGVRPLGYKAADYPGQWSRMDFVTSIPEGLPRSIHQTSTVLQRAVPIKGRGRVIATWADRNGRSSGDAAWIATSAGYWMTHVLLAPTRTAEYYRRYPWQSRHIRVNSTPQPIWHKRFRRRREPALCRELFLRLCVQEHHTRRKICSVFP